MEQNRELARDSDGGPLARVLAAACGDSKTVASQITVGSERTEDVMRRSDEQAPQILVAFLCDSLLWLTLSRFVLAGHKSEPRTDATTAAKAVMALKGEDIG